MKDLDAVVARVGDGDHAFECDEGDALRLVELSGAVAGRAECNDRRAVGAEYLDAVVARVGDGDQAAIADGDALRRRELTWAGAGRAERVGRRAVGVEYLDAVAGSVDGDGHAGQHGRRHGGAVGMRRDGDGD